MDKALTWFIRIWVALAILVNVIAIAGFIMGAPTIGEGWARVQDIYSPFNVINYILELVLVSPALGAYFWRERRRKKVPPT